MIIKWHTNVQTGIIKSEDGFICQFQKNVLVEISGLPKGISTKEIKRYSLEAILEFEKAKNSVSDFYTGTTHKKIKTERIETINMKG